VTWFLDTALVAGAAGLVSGAFVPQLIARLPEPAPEPVEARLVAAEGEEAFARRIDEPKELYADLAALPGLRWRTALATGLAAALIGGRIGWHPALLFLLYLVPVCVSLTVIDWRTRYLPTRLIAPSYLVVGALAVLASLLTSDWSALRTSVIGWLAAFGFFWLMWRFLPGAMAYGDVRWAGVLGMALGWLGVQQLVLGIYTGFVLGGVVGVLLTVAKVFHHRHSPFGPHMVVGALLAVVFPGPLGAAYGWVVNGLVSLFSG
jgi:leader peptidase (prepilin peptidase) / N-methyltransferase